MDIHFPWRLINVRLRAEHLPDTFEVPELEDVAALRPGDMARLFFNFSPDSDRENVERMWVRILCCTDAAGRDSRPHDGWFCGRLMNEPETRVGLEMGDLIEFHFTTVATIAELEDEDASPERMSIKAFFGHAASGAMVAGYSDAEIMMGIEDIYQHRDQLVAQMSAMKKSLKALSKHPLQGTDSPLGRGPLPPFNSN